MLREIRKKMVILRNRSPFPQEVKDYLNDLESRQWLYMNMELSGSSLPAEKIDTILQGGCIMDATVADHLMLERLKELRGYIYRLTDVGADLSLQILRDMEAILSGQRQDGERICMDRILYFAGQLDAAGKAGSLEQAALRHNLVLKLQPFGEDGGMLARAVMYYVVAQAGLPLATLQLSRQAYLRMYESFLQGGDSSPLMQALGEAVSGRLDLMMQLTRHER